MNVTGLHWWSVNIGSGNVDPDRCRHMASLGHNESSDIEIILIVPTSSNLDDNNHFDKTESEEKGDGWTVKRNNKLYNKTDIYEIVKINSIDFHLSIWIEWALSMKYIWTRL